MALVIGCGTFEHHGTLPPAEQSVNIMVDLLKRNGFSVVSGLEPAFADMTRLADRFIDSVKAKKESGHLVDIVFYYHGHGVITSDKMRYVMTKDAREEHRFAEDNSLLTRFAEDHPEYDDESLLQALTPLLTNYDSITEAHGYFSLRHFQNQISKYARVKFFLMEACALPLSDGTKVFHQGPVEYNAVYPKPCANQRVGDPVNDET